MRKPRHRRRHLATETQCGDREEVKVLLLGCPKLGTERGTPLLPIPPVSAPGQLAFTAVV